MYYNKTVMTEQELLQRCLKKDRIAWDEFIGRYSHVVVRSVRYKFKQSGERSSRSDLMDIVQDIFLSIWEKDKLSGIRDTSCLEGWLAMTSINMTSNYLRKLRTSAENNSLSLDAELFCVEPMLDKSSPLLSSYFNSEGNIELNELHNLLESKLAELPVKQQLALKLNVLHGKKQKDISEIMNMPAATVATLIRRGKIALKETLKPVL